MAKRLHKLRAQADNIHRQPLTRSSTAEPTEPHVTPPSVESFQYNLLVRLLVNNNDNNNNNGRNGSCLTWLHGYFLEERRIYGL